MSPRTLARERRGFPGGRQFHVQRQVQGLDTWRNPEHSLRPFRERLRRPSDQKSVVGWPRRLQPRFLEQSSHPACRGMGRVKYGNAAADAGFKDIGDEWEVRAAEDQG